MNLLWHQLVRRQTTFNIKVPHSDADPNKPRDIFRANLLFLCFFTCIGLACLIISVLTLTGIHQYYNIEMAHVSTSKDGLWQYSYLPSLIYGEPNTVPPKWAIGFHYALPADLQIGVGALAVLSAIIAFLTGYLGRSRLTLHQLASIWTFIAASNTVLAILAVAYTFADNSVSPPETGPPYYGYTIEAWVCGDGAAYVGKIHTKAGNQASDDFGRLCVQAVSTKYLSVLLLVFSLAALIHGCIGLHNTNRSSKAHIVDIPGQLEDYPKMRDARMTGDV